MKRFLTYCRNLVIDLLGLHDWFEGADLSLVPFVVTHSMVCPEYQRNMTDRKVEISICYPENSDSVLVENLHANITNLLNPVNIVNPPAITRKSIKRSDETGIWVTINDQVIRFTAEDTFKNEIKRSYFKALNTVDSPKYDKLVLL